MTNPFRQRIPTNSPTFTLSAMALVLGLFLGLAVVTERQRREVLGQLSPDQQIRIQAGALDVQEELVKLQQEVTTLREKVGQFEKAAAADSGQETLLQRSLQEYKATAALSELTGPGLVVTLLDSRAPAEELPIDAQIIHDRDVLNVVNELWAAGAEGISINGQRVGPRTPIRCVGPVIHVNFLPVSPPIKVRAIGDPATLEGALTLPGGIIDDLKLADPKMVQMERVDKMILPAFSGALTFRIAKVPAEGGDR